jgi:hypothetical protein
MLERFQQLIGNGFSLHLWNGLLAFVTVMIISPIPNAAVKND